MTEPDEVSTSLAQRPRLRAGGDGRPRRSTSGSRRSWTRCDCADGVLFYLAIPPDGLRAPSSSSLSAAGLTKPATPDGWRRVIVEKPFGTDLDSARELNRAPALALRRVADLPHRSLPRQGDRPEPAGVPLRQRDVRAGVEPPLHRSRADHRRRDRRRRAPRRLLRRRRRAARHGAEPPDAGARADRDGAADRVHRRERPRSQDGRARCRSSRSSSGRRATSTWCAPSTRPAGSSGDEVPGYRAGAGRRSASRRPRPSSALRLQLDSWRWAGVPFYLRTGKRLPKRTHRDRDPVPPAAAPDLQARQPDRRSRRTC